MAISEREAILKRIETLPDEALLELGEFVEYLEFKRQRRGSGWLKEAYHLFEPLRQEITNMNMSDEEVDQLLDEALEEVRHERNLKRSD